MKTIAATAALLLCAAGFASAQDDRERKFDDLRREMERSMKALQEKFDGERERLQKEFKAARERLLEKKEEHKDEDRKPRDVEGMLRELLKRVEGLEKKLGGELPRLRELPRMLPRDFDFKRFENGVPDEWRKWLEQMPRFKGGEDFKFEFRKGEPKKDKEDERREKPKKKDDKDC